jgi:hypothetical protein
MAKPLSGRISGLNGMDTHTSTELYSWANELEAQIRTSENRDDPKWLQRRVDRLRQLAKSKEKALETKQRKRSPR